MVFFFFFFFFFLKIQISLTEKNNAVRSDFLLWGVLPTLVYAFHYVLRFVQFQKPKVLYHDISYQVEDLELHIFFAKEHPYMI